ncbi:hypothetical protein Tco_0889204 [Tanacetum coccineum]
MGVGGVEADALKFGRLRIVEAKASVGWAHVNDLIPLDLSGLMLSQRGGVGFFCIIHTFSLAERTCCRIASSSSILGIIERFSKLRWEQIQLRPKTCFSFLSLIRPSPKQAGLEGTVKRGLIFVSGLLHSTEKREKEKKKRLSAILSTFLTTYYRIFIIEACSGIIRCCRQCSRVFGIV